MAFNQATWIDRDSEHPNRRTLTNVNDPTDVKTYDMSRAEGTVTTQGTPIGASTMNDLETRIASAFTEVNNNMPVANPSGEATDELEKVKIGNTIFSVEGTSVEKGTIQNVAIASFSDGADNVPVASLIVDIEAVQAGSGTPSPSNPRPISGHSTCTIKVNDDIDDPQTEITTAIALGQTVYGGSLNVTTGVLTITHISLLINSLLSLTRIATSTSGVYRWQCSLTPYSSVISNMNTGYVSSKLANAKADDIYRGTAPDNSIGINTSVLYVRCDSATTVEEFNNLIGDTQLVYELATPIEIQLTPTEVRTLLNDNNIFADTGDVDELVYFKTGCEPIARLIEAYGYTEVEGTLAAGQTSITLTSNAITSNSTIDVYTDADVDYSSISVTTGSVTITFEAQASNMKVKARIS